MRGGGQSPRRSLNVIGWRHTHEYGSLSVILGDPLYLVWEIISVSEKRMKSCIVKIIDNVFEKDDEGGLFPLSCLHQLIIAIFRMLYSELLLMLTDTNRTSVFDALANQGSFRGKYLPRSVQNR